MGKATMDLPELAEAPPANASEGAATDDLLAQLAGQEIDRLLAEADAQPVASQSSMSETAPAPVAEATSVVAPPIAQPAPPVPAKVIDAESVPAEGTVANLLPKLDAAQMAAPTVTAPEPLDPELEEATRDPAGATDRMSLDLALGSAAASLAEEDGDDDETLPLYLRPLEWLNAWIEEIPESVLEISGKIAILTLVNAVAVMLYVLFFRHH